MDSVSKIVLVRMTPAENASVSMHIYPLLHVLPFVLFPSGDYQRLEFLGDAILQFLASKYVYHRFPSHNEGHLSVSEANKGQ